MKSRFDSAAQLLLHSSSAQVEVLQVFINETTVLQLVIINHNTYITRVLEDLSILQNKAPEVFHFLKQ